MEDWKKPLEEDAKNFFSSEVEPAFTEIRTKLEKRGKEVKIETKAEKSLTITIMSGGEEEFSYTIITKIYRPTDDFPQGYVCPEAEKTVRHKTVSIRETKSPFYFQGSQCNYSISSVSKDKIIEHFKRMFAFQLRELNF